MHEDPVKAYVLVVLVIACIAMWSALVYEIGPKLLQPIGA